MMRAVLLVLALVALSPAQEWKLLWSDEFNGPAGAKPDSSKWTYDLGKTGWGNNELERYTSDAQNASYDGWGHLVIRAMRDASGEITSARLKTQAKFEVTYGKIEARIALPSGQGIWPAFWMLGNDIGTTGWPGCGEIDIMERINVEALAHGTVHGPGYSGGKGISAKVELAHPGAFHTYAAIWEPGRIRLLLDDHQYAEVTPASLPAGTKWVYDHPFFLLLNLAVGGNWPGNPDASTQFPAEMVVDWVRVWQHAGAEIR